ncbi:MAG: hypothetical protein CVV04_01995 [Firmicutes bacterium HGW-Firmicutes-9]|jgi:hypothetical protein|nr:MAG: hypothetical protein CVV04_01995 [Firmicutes bacterium HGW-Firmicutes-9]
MNPKQKNALIKIFAISGTVMLWAPILFMFITAIFGSIARKTLLFDYLMLAEMFPIVALGLVLLIFTTLLTRTFRKWFGWGSVSALVALVAGNLVAVASGLASGTASESGGYFMIVIVSIVVFNILVVALAILAIMLLRRIFQKKQEPTPEA